MDFNIEIRKKQLDSLDQLIALSKDRLGSVLQYLGWDMAKVKEEGEPLGKCPINLTHNVSANSIRGHVEKCLIKSEGYQLNEKFLSHPPDDSQQTITLDNFKKIEILSRAYTENSHFRQAWNGRDPDPKTSDRLTWTFSPQERLVIYDYSIKNTIGPVVPPEFTTIHSNKNKDDRCLSYEELLAQERDAKRRRAKYRSVHVNRKNHTEVIREVINGQMEEYKEWLICKKHDQNEEHNSNIKMLISNGKIEEQERPHSSFSKNSNYSGSSRSTSRRRHRSRDRYNRSRDRSRRSKYDRSRDRRRSKEKSSRRSRDRSSRRRSSRHRDRSRSRRSNDENYK